MNGNIPKGGLLGFICYISASDWKKIAYTGHSLSIKVKTKNEKGALERETRANEKIKKDGYEERAGKTLVTPDLSNVLLVKKQISTHWLYLNIPFKLNDKCHQVTELQHLFALCFLVQLQNPF